MTRLVQRFGRPRRPLVALAAMATLVAGVSIALALGRPNRGPAVAPAPPASPRVPARPEVAASPPREVPLYVVPAVDDFRPEYDRDAANRAVETWDVYWGWVNTYYRGNLLARGWANESRACLEGVADPAARGALAEALNDLGRLVAREWAKNKAVRRIDTDDVKAWGHRLDRSRRDDGGQGSKLLATIRAIRDEAARKLDPAADSAHDATGSHRRR